MSNAEAGAELAAGGPSYPQEGVAAPRPHVSEGRKATWTGGWDAETRCETESPPSISAMEDMLKDTKCLRIVPAPTDHLANERTFLAWVRTAVTIMGLGFVVAKFGLFLRELAGAGSSATASPISEGVGVFLVLAGAILMALAFLKFRRTHGDLEAGNYVAGYALELLLTAVMLAVGVGLAVYLLGTG